MGERPNFGLPLVLIYHEYLGFLDNILNVTVSKNSPTPNSWIVQGEFSNNKVNKPIHLQFKEIESRPYLVHCVALGGSSGITVEMAFKGWMDLKGYSVPESIAITRIKPDGDILSREQFMMQTPPKIIPRENKSFEIEIPVYAYVQDYRLGERITYQAGLRLPTVKELQAMQKIGGKAKADYFRKAANRYSSKTIISPIVLISIVIILALFPLFLTYKRKNLKSKTM